jgi:hypothetical protein
LGDEVWEEVGSELFDVPATLEIEILRISKAGASDERLYRIHRQAPGRKS